MARIWLIVVVVTVAVISGCGGSGKAVLGGGGDTSPAQALLSAQGALSTLPQDGVQPWESVDGSGYVIPQSSFSGADLQVRRGTEDPRHSPSKSASAFPAGSEFTVGRDRFLEGGNVFDSGEASQIFADFGATPLSYAIYRLPMGGSQPGALAVDANLKLGLHGRLSEYWIGVSDYANDQWEWHGPLTDAQAAFTLSGPDYTSPLGNTFVAVAVYGGSDIELVGVMLSPRDGADSTAPPALSSAPQLTPRASALEVEWLPVIAGDLAGYRVYWSYSPFTAASDNGVQTVEWLENTTRLLLPAPTSRLTWVGITAVDVNGNASAMSPVASAKRLDNSAPPLMAVQVSPVSALRGEPVTLSIIPDTGAPIASYDLDLDGDGVFEVTGTTATSHSVPTDATGIIRPRVRASSGDGMAVTLGSVSLIVTGNQRPVANLMISPATGVAPLTADITIEGEDFDGSIVEYDFDFDGDGIYEFISFGANTTPYPYNAPGLYNSKGRVVDDQGAWDVDTVAVYVTSGVAISALPNYAQPGQQVTLTATPNGSGVAYAWDLDNNGTFEVNTGAVNKVTTSFTQSGDHTVGVRVTMAGGPDQLGVTTVRVAGWRLTNVHAPEPELEGETLSLAMVAGKPAIVYINHNPGDKKLQYVRSTDPDGVNWGAPVTIETSIAAEYPGVWPALAVVNGRPAVAGVRQFGVSYELRYWRANDAAGSSWGASVLLDNTLGNAGNDRCDMTMLQSAPPRPAVAFLHPASGQIRYVRAADADGAGWDPAQVIVGGSTPSLVIADGYPAIGYSGPGEARYVRALDNLGTAWGASALVAGSAAYPTLAMVQGRPAMMYVYLSGGNYYLLFTPATDSAGTAWGVTSIANISPMGQIDARLVVAGGIPAALYSPGGTSISSVTALAADGSTWAQSMPAAISAPGVFMDAADVNGSPAFAAPQSVGGGNYDVIYGRLY